MEWSCCPTPSLNWFLWRRWKGGRQRRREILGGRYNNRLSLGPLSLDGSLLSVLLDIQRNPIDFIFLVSSSSFFFACTYRHYIIYIYRKILWGNIRNDFWGLYLSLSFRDLGHILEYELDRWDNRLYGRFYRTDWLGYDRMMENSYIHTYKEIFSFYYYYYYYFVVFLVF